MKLKCIILSIIVILTNTILSQQKLIEQDVRKSVMKFGKAFVRADFSILEKLICENYVHINGKTGKRIQKKSWLNWNKSRQQIIEKGEYITSNYEIKDMQITIFENTAIVVGIIKSDGLDKGIPFQSHLRFSNVWLLENNKLCRAFFHDSEIK